MILRIFDGLIAVIALALAVVLALEARQRIHAAAAAREAAEAAEAASDDERFGGVPARVSEFERRRAAKIPDGFDDRLAQFDRRLESIEKRIEAEAREAEQANTADNRDDDTGR